MADENRENTEEAKNSKNIFKRFTKSLSGVDSLIDEMNMSLFGTTSSDDSDKLNERFNDIMSREVNRVTGNGSNDYTTFLGKVYANDKESAATIKTINEKLNLDSQGGGINPSQFINEQYKNRMLKQADAHQIANQLVELKEAKGTMRDAILSADINTGRINRNIVFENSTGNDWEKDYNPVVEEMEKHFDTPKKIKDFIVDNLLDYGEYYVYTIPYSKIFEDFASRYRTKADPGTGHKFFESADSDAEEIRFQYICESAECDSKGVHENDDISCFFEDVNDVLHYDKKSEEYERLESDVRTLVSSDRFTISTEAIPIPVLENGLSALKELQNDYITEEGDQFTFRKDGEKMGTDVDAFIRKYGSKDYSDDGTFKSEEDDGSKNFSDIGIKDCYIKMIDPTRMIPVEIMGETLFYIYIQTEDATPLNTILSYQSILKTRDPGNTIDNLVQDIANRIVSKFNKKFVSENKEFRNLIVSALQFYDLGNTKIHFQVIPKEYITAFKINVDEDGHGRSMLEDSLFYAKLYLMLLMFKIVTIITKSNDQEINYLRTSGIDKNVYNKAQEIARRKRARQITVNDMFSYTGVINKIASGSSIYMPLGKNGEKPIETEILQGQSVEINGDLMEMLRNNYILGSGVPAAIINYLNEADFAKSIENANTKMNGRVINFQLDINEGLTDWYRKILRYSTTIPEEVIREIRVVLPPPKGSSNITTQELINNYTNLQDFIVKMYFGDSPDDDIHYKEFVKELAKMHLPMINFSQIDELFKKTKLSSTEKKINPDTDDDNMDLGNV